MPIMRNPFRKQDENLRPAAGGLDKNVNGTAPKSISVRESDSVEYQLSGKSPTLLYDVLPSLLTAIQQRSMTAASSSHLHHPNGRASGQQVHREVRQAAEASLIRMNPSTSHANPSTLTGGPLISPPARR